MTTEIGADWILKTMAAMAAADGRLDAREVRVIQDVYLELTGRPVDVSGVMMAVQMYASKRDVLVELTEVAGGLGAETKEAIVRGAYRTLAANNHVSDGERKKLDAIAAALRLSGAQLQAILEQD